MQNENLSLHQRRDSIRSQALALGFSVCGFAPALMPARNSEGYADALAKGYHADMAWMAERVAQRSSPTGLWPEAKSVISLGTNYGPEFDPMTKLSQPRLGNISAYALDLDYHDILKKRLKALGRWMQDTYGGQLKVFVDTAPVLEKPLAQQAGLGWQGKHSNLVSRDFGAWLFLGEIYTTLELPRDAPEVDHCGSCRKCLDVCPTNAFPKPYQLDARACLAYLSIEHKGPIPLKYRKAMGNRIYGCDDCLAICPWNKFAQVSAELSFKARDVLEAPDLADFLTLDDRGFRTLFRKSPIKRIGRDRFVRNVCIAAGNSGQQDYGPALRALEFDGSDVVADAATWALAELKETAAI